MIDGLAVAVDHIDGAAGIGFEVLYFPFIVDAIAVWTKGIGDGRFAEDFDKDLVADRTITLTCNRKCIRDIIHAEYDWMEDSIAAGEILIGGPEISKVYARSCGLQGDLSALEHQAVRTSTDNRIGIDDHGIGECGTAATKTIYRIQADLVGARGRVGITEAGIGPGIPVIEVPGPGRGYPADLVRGIGELNGIAQADFILIHIENRQWLCMDGRQGDGGIVHTTGPAGDLQAYRIRSRGDIGM